jgi:primosomal protein N' (replication factor Y)
MESFFNTVKKKYILLTPPEQIPRPRVEVINMKTAKTVTPYLSQRAVQAAKFCMEEQEKALFFLNRRGYSLIQCAECNDIRSCPECGIPLIYHKSKGLLECHYCTRTEHPSNTCRMCKGTRLEMIGAGTQRIAAEIKKHLHIEPLRFDRDSIRDEPGLRSLADISQGEKIVVGTKAVAGRLGEGDTYKLCVFLNPDISLHLPDFRSAEILFQEIVGTSECVRRNGLIIIQTKMPDNDVFTHMKKYRFTDFSREELSRRKSLAYPPFSRMIVITVTSKSDAGRTVAKALPPEDEKIEIIGPLDLPGKATHTYKMILKSQAKERLRLYAKEFLTNLKHEKGLRVIADVDPISL